MSENKRFYWFKFLENFFDDEKISALEAVPNGHSYVLFLIKIMAKACKSQGTLRIADAVPYSDKIFAQVTGMDIDTVRSAIAHLSKLGMVEILADGTYYIQNMERLVGTETDRAEKMRMIREKRRGNIVTQTSVTELPDIRVKSIESRDKSQENKDSLDACAHATPDTVTHGENELFEKAETLKTSSPKANRETTNRSKGKKKAQGSAGPNTTALRAYWYERYKARIGIDYPSSFAADGAVLKRLLAACGDEPTARKALDAYLADTYHEPRGWPLTTAGAAGVMPGLVAKAKGAQVRAVEPPPVDLKAYAEKNWKEKTT